MTTSTMPGAQERKREEEKALPRLRSRGNIGKWCETSTEMCCSQTFTLHDLAATICQVLYTYLGPNSFEDALYGVVVRWSMLNLVEY